MALMSEYFNLEEPPEPEYVVICSSTLEWKRQARLVAAFAKSVLLVGADDVEFAKELAERFQLQIRIDEIRKTTLLWDPMSFSAPKPKPRAESSPAAVIA